MVKVLIYSSKELFENSSYEGRAEADFIAWNTGTGTLEDPFYTVVKNRKPSIWVEGLESVFLHRIQYHIERVEQDEWRQDMKKHKLKTTLRE